MENNKNIEKLFAEKLKGHSVAPPQDLWGRIEKELPIVPVPAGMGGFSKFMISATGMIVVLLSSLFMLVEQENLSPVAKEFNFQRQLSSFTLPDSHPTPSDAQLTENVVNPVNFKREVTSARPLRINNNLQNDLAVSLMPRSFNVNFDRIKPQSQEAVSTILIRSISNADEFNITERVAIMNASVQEDISLFAYLPDFNALAYDEMSPIATGVVSIPETRILNSDLTKEDLPSAAEINKSAFAALTTETVSDDNFDNPFAEQYSFNQSEVKGLYAGTSASINQTVLLKSKTEGNQEDIDLNSQFNFGAGYGFQLGYNFNNKFGIQADLVLNSKQGQLYESTTRWNENVEKRINLNYTLLPVTFKWKSVKTAANNKPLVFNLIAGIQYGFLKTSQFYVDEEQVYPHQNLNRHDFSVIAGIDYDVYLHKNFFVSMGIRGTIGRKLNTLGIEGINTDKRNFTFGGRVGLNYVLSSFDGKK